MLGIKAKVSVNTKLTLTNSESTANIVLNDDGKFFLEDIWRGNGKIPKMWLRPEYDDKKNGVFAVKKFFRGAAHEFGHALGIDDAYAATDRNLPEAPNDNINVFPNSLMKNHLATTYIISGNDIEMLLWAWTTKNWQQYQPDSKKSQAFYE